jgi:hypothetical protein
MLCPLNLRPHLAHPDRPTRFFIIIIPPPLLPTLIQIKLELRPALLPSTPPSTSEMEGRELEASTVEGDEGRELGIWEGVRQGGGGFGGGGRDEGGGMFFLNIDLARVREEEGQNNQTDLAVTTSPDEVCGTSGAGDLVFLLCLYQLEAELLVG